MNMGSVTQHRSLLSVFASVAACSLILLLLTNMSVAEPPHALDPLLCGIGQPARFLIRELPVENCTAEIASVQERLRRHAESSLIEPCPGCLPDAKRNVYDDIQQGTDSTARSPLEKAFRSPDDSERYKMLSTIDSIMPSREALELLRCLAIHDPNIMVQDQASKRFLHWVSEPLESKGLFFCNGIDIADEQSRQHALQLARRTIDQANQQGHRDSGGTDNAQKIEKVTEHHDDGPAASMAIILGLLGSDKDVPRLEALLSSSNNYAALEAAKALTMLRHSDRALPALKRLSTSSSSGDSYYPGRARWMLRQLQQPSRSPWDLWREMNKDIVRRDKRIPR